MLEIILSDTLTSTPVLDALKKNYVRGTRHLVIVPDRFTLSYERAVLKELNLKGTFDIEVASFSRLADNALERAGVGALDSLSEVMLLRKVIENNRGRLQCFSRSSSGAGFCSEMYAVLSQIRASGVSSSALESASGKLRGKTARKAADIALLYSEYEKAMGALQDNQSKLELLSDLVKGGEWKDAHVYISDFTGFTAVEEDIVCAFASASLSLTVCLPGSAGANNGRIYPVNCVSRLKDAAQRAGVQFKERFFRQLSGDFAVIGDNLFGYGGKKFSSRGSVTLTCAPMADSEIRQVARIIKQAVSEGGYRYRDMAVVCCDRTEYQGIVEKVFSDFGIPVYFDVRSPLAATAGARLLMSAVTAVLYGYEKRDVTEFVKCPLTGIDSDSADAFENYVLHSGADRSAFTSPFRLELEDMDVAERVRARAESLLSRLKIFTGKATAKQFKQAVTEFFNACGFVENNARLTESIRLSDPAQAMVNEQSVAALSRILDSAEEVFGEDTVSAAMYAEVLFSAIAARNISTVPLSLDCVYVGQVGESRYEDCKFMFVAGASSGKLPQESADSGLLTDSDVEEWRRHDADVRPNAKERSLSYKLSALMTLVKPSERLYVSYCASDRSGKKTQPASAVRELSELLGIPVSYVRETPEKITGINELARYLGGRGNAKSALITFARLLRDNVRILDYNDLNALYGYVGEKYGEEYVAHTVEGRDMPFEGGDLTQEVLGSGYASASGLERYAACPFEYFMQYVLGVKEREESALNVRDTGTLLHAVMEKFFASGKPYDLSLEELEEFAEEVIQSALETPEFLYLKGIAPAELARLKKRAAFILHSLCANMAEGAFRPYRTELKFGMGEDGLPPVEVEADGRKVKLRGVIDRVDKWGDYVVVVDYKSKKASTMSVKPVNVAKGERIQTFIYMTALLNSDKNLKPAGVFYLPLGNDYVSASSSADRYYYVGFAAKDPELVKACDPGGTGRLYPYSFTSKGVKAAKSGTLLSQEGFEKYCSYVLELISRNLKDMKDGFIQPSPGSESVCTYCNFANVCGRKGEGVRNEKYKDVSVAGGEGDDDGVE